MVQTRYAELVDFLADNYPEYEAHYQDALNVVTDWVGNGLVEAMTWEDYDATEAEDLEFKTVYYDASMEYVYTVMY